MIHLMLLVNRQGKIRLMKWYDCFKVADRHKHLREISWMVIGRNTKLCNFIEWGQYKIIFKRYASLYFTILCDKEDNEIIMWEWIQHFVEMWDRYFGNVCEWDIIFNYHKAYYIIEEIWCSGYIQESDKKEIIRLLNTQDTMWTEEKEEDYSQS